MKLLVTIQIVLMGFGLTSANASAKEGCRVASINIIDSASRGNSHAWSNKLTGLMNRAETRRLLVDTTLRGVKITQPDRRADFASLASRLSQEAEKLNASFGQKFVVEMPSATEILMTSQAKRGAAANSWSSSFDSIINRATEVEMIGLDYVTREDGVSLRLHYINDALCLTADELKRELDGTQWKVVVE